MIIVNHYAYYVGFTNIITIMISNDSVTVLCRHCDRSTLYSRDTIINEIKRLETYNYEILTCQFCSHKYSKEDFKKSLGSFKSSTAMEAISKGASFKPETIYYNDTDKEVLEAVKIAEDAIKNLKSETEKIEISQKREAELKKMQEGQDYDEKLVGPIEMEQGTPGDRRCVRILKTEGKIYGYAYLAGKYIFKAIDYIITKIILAIITIATFIWEIIKKINWCIVCSAARITSFAGYGALLLYSVVSLGVFGKPIFESFYTSWVVTTNAPNNFYTYIAWTFLIIFACSIPILIQLCWALGTPTSRWAKVIRKSADRFMK